MNAPEKIYILPHKDYSDKRIINAFTEKEDNNDIEYTRTDAFIEKACEYLDGLIELLNDHGHGLKKERIINGLKQAMKGE